MPCVSLISSKFGQRRKPPTVATKGSLYFNGTSTSNLSIPNDIDLRMGTGDFTIEWYQYLQSGSGNANPRVFSIGSYSTASIAVSIEGANDTSRIFYVWVSGANNMGSADYTNKWIHFAISRSGTSLRVFKDGTQIGNTLTNSTNFNNTTQALRIGNETTTSTGASFKGYITNFRIVKGTALYTANFTKPSSPLTAVSGTVLLLLATDDANKNVDSSSAAKTVTNSSVTWNSLSPF
jgi:hypothetical protein